MISIVSRSIAFSLVLSIVLAGGLYLPVARGSAYAQSAVDGAAGHAEQLERDRAAGGRQRLIDENRFSSRPPGGANAWPPQGRVVLPDGACIQVDMISVAGMTLIEGETAREIIALHEGRCLELDEISDLLKQLTFLYAEKGYIASRAFFPQQDMSGGSLEIAVVEDSLEDIVIDDSPGDYGGQIGTAFPNMIGKPVNANDIKQGLDQLNRLRSNRAAATLGAGANLGSSVLLVSRNKSKNWHATLGFDDLGSSSTGKYQSRIDLGLEDVLRLNERWHFSYQRSMDDHPLSFSDVPGSDTYTGSFSMPYGYWTFAVDGLWSEYESEIFGIVPEVDTSGLSRSISASLSRVVNRDRISTTSLSAGMKWKRTENFILGNRVDVSSRDLSIGTLELVHSRRLWNGQLVISVGYNRGLDVRGAFDDDTAPAGSPKGQFRSVNGSLSYFKPFKPGGLMAAYSGQISGQYTPDLLFGSEQVAYGGPSTVRGLRESVVFGNRGIMTRNEFSLQLSQTSNEQFTKLFGVLEAYASIDFGHVFEESKLEIDGGNLAGATIGLRSRGGRLGFDVAWSDIVESSGNLAAQVSESGVIYAKASLAF